MPSESGIDWSTLITAGVVSAVVSGTMQLVLKRMDRQAREAEADRTEGAGKKLADVGGLYDRCLNALREADVSLPWGRLSAESDNLVGLAKAVGMPKEFVGASECIRLAVRYCEENISILEAPWPAGDESEHLAMVRTIANCSEWAGHISVAMRQIYETEDMTRRFRRKLTKEQRSQRAKALDDLRLAVCPVSRPQAADPLDLRIEE